MLAVVDDKSGFIAQKEGRLMKYSINDSQKIVSIPLHFEKGNFFQKF